MNRTFLALAATLALAAPGHGALHSYQISGVITNAPNVPNFIPGGPEWAFDSIPATFTGSFIADCLKHGPVQELSLEIGGVDVVAAHPNIVVNFFDPLENRLFWAALSGDVLLPGDILIDPSFISLGNTTNTPGAAFDRIVAVQNVRAEDKPPGDPIFIRSINFEGSFEVSKGPRVAVPDSGSSIVGASIACGILLTVSGLRGRKARQSP